MRRTAVVGILVMAGLAGASNAAATFPGRSGELMYSSYDASGKSVSLFSGVHAFEPRTKGRRSVFRCGWFIGADDSCRTGDAAVTADGQRMAVLVHDLDGSFTGLGWRLVLVTPSGDEIQSVPLERRASDVTWSPNGDTLLVTDYGGTPDGRGDGSPRIVLIGADGRTLGPVTGEGASDGDWAANDEIAYVQDGDVWVTRLGGAPRRLTTAGGGSPSWSPTGRMLAFVRAGRLWTMRADGTRERELVDVEAAAPAWSPDGRYIAFSQPFGESQGGSGEIWVTRADGRCPHRVVRPENDYAGNSSPLWRPLASAKAPRAYRPRCLSRAERRRLARRCARKHGVAKRRCLALLKRR